MGSWQTPPSGPFSTTVSETKPMPPPRPDYNHTHLLWFVTGALRRYAETTGALPLEGIGFDSYLEDTLHKTILHVEGRAVIDARFSDFQCDVAAAAKKYFGSPASA